MTPQQFKAARAKLKLSVAQLAHILDTTPRTVSRWQSGDVSPQAARMVEWMLDGYRPKQWPLRPQFNDPRRYLQDVRLHTGDHV